MPSSGTTDLAISLTSVETGLLMTTAGDRNLGPSGSGGDLSASGSADLGSRFPARLVSRRDGSGDCLRGLSADLPVAIAVAKGSAYPSYGV